MEHINQILFLVALVMWLGWVVTKRYFFVDPVLRAWVRLHAQGPLPPAGRVAAIAAEILAGAEPDPDAAPGSAPLESAITEPEPAPEPVRLRRPSDPLMEID